MVFKVILVVGVLLLTACGSQGDAELNILGEFVLQYDMDGVSEVIKAGEVNEADEIKETDEVAEATDAEETGEALELVIHWCDGDLQIVSFVEGLNRFLYEVPYGENSLLAGRRLAEIPALMVWWGHLPTEWCSAVWIFQLDVVDDWVVFTAGEMQGSMRNFFGNLLRVHRGGLGYERFGMGSMSYGFYVIDGWVYQYFWSHQPWKTTGWYRIRPDGDVWEFVGDFIYRLLKWGADGYIYGEHAVTGRGNLARWLPGSDAPVLLFAAGDAPYFEGLNPVISYVNIALAAGYVYFTVQVNGFCRELSHAINWGDPVWENLYEARFRVAENGESRTLLHEEWFERRILDE